MVSSLRLFSFLLLPEYVCRDALMGIFYQPAGKVKSFSPQSLPASEHDAATRAAITSFLVLPPPPSAAAVLHPTVRRPVTDLLTSSTVSPHLVDWRFGSFVSFLAASRWTPSGSCPSRSLTSATSGSAAPPFHFSGYFFDNMPVESVRGAHSSGRKPFVTSRKPLCIWRGCRHRANYGSKMLIMSLNILIVVLLLRCLP